MTANDNPLTLNALGQPDTDIFLSDLAYKVVLAPSGSDDPPNSTIFTADNYYIPPTTAKFNSGSGNPNGSVAGTAGSVGVPASVYWDYSNAVLYVATTTGIAAAAVWTAVTPATPPVTPQGRLTLTSNTPVISTGVTAGTSVYYTPHVGNRVPIYDGSAFSNSQFAQLTLSLVASHVANAIYDVFVFLNSSTVTVGTGPAWTTATFGSGDRGTGAATTELTRVQGVLVNNVAITARNGSNTYSVAANKATYVGTILIDGTNGQISCLLATGISRRWGVFNAYSRHRQVMRCVNPAESWITTTASWRAANNDTTNSITIIQGLVEDSSRAEYSVNALPAGSGVLYIGIGLNDSTNPSSPRASTVDDTSSYLTTSYLANLPLGGNVLYAIEVTDGVNGGTYDANLGLTSMFSVEFFA